MQPSAESRFNELRDRAQIKMALDQKLARSVIYRVGVLIRYIELNYI